MNAGRLILAACAVYATGVLCWLVSALPAASGVHLAASPRYAIAPASVTLTIMVEHDARNRWLVVEVDGDYYFASSTEQLEGERAPRLRQRFYDRLPEGRYVAVATVTQADQRTRRAQTTFCFAGGDVTCADGGQE